MLRVWFWALAAEILAKKLWGGPMTTRFFPCFVIVQIDYDYMIMWLKIRVVAPLRCYLLICLALSHLTNEALHSA